MLIDNEKFIGLLADNSGIEKEKVEKYLEELISEIKASFDEGEGYEVEGFGIFSKLGSNILFIPSDELETEINYKYVGMEPLELPGGIQQQEVDEPEDDENPIQGILDGGKTEEREEYEDPFAELFNEAEEHEKAIQEQAEKGDLSEEEIEAVVEEEIESEDTEEIITEEQEQEEEPEEALEDTLKDIFGSDEFETETESETEEDSTPGPENWGIDAHKEEEQEGAFSGLLGDAEEEPELIDEEDIFASEDEITSEEEEASEPENEVAQEETLSEEEKENEIDFSALEDDSSEEDFDDPFDELIEEDDDEDFVPVVTNVSSGKASKKDAGEEKNEGEDEKTEKKSRTPKSPRDKKQSSPVFLYLILGLLLLGGTGYLLAYFGVVNIEGITPSSASTQITQNNTPPVTQPESTPPQTVDPQDMQSEEEEPMTETNSGSIQNETEENPGISSDSEPEVTQEETPQNQQNDIAPLVADEKAPGDGGIISPVNIQAEAEVYGLNGTATEAGNNGYTIVLYTLSRKSGADAQFEKLSKEGFRVIIKEKPSQQFGALYRVSIGQFESLTDAAVAAETVDSEILGNYIITKI